MNKQNTAGQTHRRDERLRKMREAERYAESMVYDAEDHDRRCQYACAAMIVHALGLVLDALEDQ